MADLTAYRVTLSDGTSYVTSMAAGVTLSAARDYFMGQVLVDECPESGRETRRIVVAVEPAAMAATRAYWIYGTNRPVGAIGAFDSFAPVRIIAESENHARQLARDSFDYDRFEHWHITKVESE
mgnify:CR=1 FL=1